MYMASQMPDSPSGKLLICLGKYLLANGRAG